jgi:hypothetical protein
MELIMIYEKKELFQKFFVSLNSLKTKIFLFGCIILISSIQPSNCMNQEYESQEDSYRLPRGYGYTGHYSLAPVTRERRYEAAPAPVELYRPRSIFSLPESSDATFNNHFHDFSSEPKSRQPVLLGTRTWRQSIEDQGDLGTCASFATVEGLKFPSKHISFSRLSYC